MSAAIRAASAAARATIAARILKTTKPWPQGYGLGRSFSNCFEMGDGDEVVRILAERMLRDPALAEGIRTHYTQAPIACLYSPVPNRPYTVILMCNEWEDFSIYLVEAPTPERAIIEAVAQAFGYECKYMGASMAAADLRDGTIVVTDASVLPGHHPSVFNSSQQLPLTLASM